MGDLFIYTGSDEATAAEEARKKVDALVGADKDDFNPEVFRTSDTRDDAAILDDLMSSINTPPFLVAVKTCWLQNYSGFANESAASVKSPGDLGKAIRRFTEMVKEPLPDYVNIVINASGIDKRKPFYKAISKVYKFVVFDKPDMNSRNWQQQVAELLRHRAQDKQMELSRDVIAYLMEVIGDDTGRIDPELEKLLCYAGEQPSLRDAREICIGQREASAFAINDALGKRNLGDAFTVISQSLEHSKSPDSDCMRLTRMMGRYFREVLHAKLLLAGLKVSPRELGAKIKQLGDDAKMQFPHNPLLGIHPFRLQLLAEAAERYGGPELVDIISWLAEFDKLNVSSSLPRRLALETLTMRIIKGHQQTIPTAASRL